MNEYPFDLGTYSRTVSTQSEAAQRWFDRGLNWTFAYHHEEAGKCFAQALQHDPNLAMAHWGLAYIIGPNYNQPWELFDQRQMQNALQQSRESLAAARECMASATAVEQAMINALTARYQAAEPIEDMYQWSRDYSEEMRKTYDAFADDPDVAAFYVEAMMNLTPWKMWDPRTGKPVADAQTLLCKQVLEQALAKFNSAGSARHPGLLHLYIHLMEMSPTPEVALNVADDLRHLVPDAGHLKHMSTHIDVLCGDYQAVVAGNSAGIDADLKYYTECGAMNFYSLYRVHNYHFKLYGAMFLGQFEAAMDAVNGLRDTLPEELIRMQSPPMADFVEGYLSMETHALVRFGKWQALIDAPLPDDAELYTVTTALNHYGKGIAHAALKNHGAALQSQRDFASAVERVSDTRCIHVVSCLDILAIAGEMLAGEIHYHNGSYERAFDHLRQAVRLEDALPYDEPWGWMMPSRHALGALLLEQNSVDEALEVYEADLGLNDHVIRSNQHPDNVWALVGLHECYQRQGRDRDARMLRPRRDIALARADGNIGVSCFCRAASQAPSPAQVAMEPA